MEVFELDIFLRENGRFWLLLLFGRGRRVYIEWEIVRANQMEGSSSRFRCCCCIIIIIGGENIWMIGEYEASCRISSIVVIVLGSGRRGRISCGIVF